MTQSVPHEDFWFAAKGITIVILCLLVLIITMMGLMPLYWVYHQRQEGEAMLAKAEYSKKVLVQDALARMESAKSLAEAEVIRAEGVAKANQIIGKSLENSDAYLHYLWLHNLEVGDHDVIYIPTEAGLPIFEAGGRFQPRKSSRLRSGEVGTPEHPDAVTKDD